MNLKIFTAFSGYDSQALAMRELAAAYGFNYDLVGWSEIEPHAIYCNIGSVLHTEYYEKLNDIEKSIEVLLHSIENDRKSGQIE